MGIWVKLRLRVSEQESSPSHQASEVEPHRLIPTQVKIEVWKRDNGRCVLCGRKDNLHFDRIIPFSKGGTSLLATNIQLRRARHNLSKHKRIDHGSGQGTAHCGFGRLGYLKRVLRMISTPNVPFSSRRATTESSRLIVYSIWITCCCVEVTLVM